MSNAINISSTNFTRVSNIKNCVTTKLIDSFYSDKTKKYLIINSAVSFHSDACYARLNIIVAREQGDKNTQERRDTPHFTISYLKNKSPFYYNSKSYNFNNLTEKKKSIVFRKIFYFFTGRTMGIFCSLPR